MGQPVFGPNDFHTKGGHLMPGLGPEEEARIIEMRGGTVTVVADEPPSKTALRAQSEALKTKARQLSTAERELEREREAAEAELTERERKVAEREALVEAQLKQLEG